MACANTRPGALGQTYNYFVFNDDINGNVTLTVANDGNFGTIYSLGQSNGPFEVYATPEPSFWVGLSGLSCMGLIGLVWRRRQVHCGTLLRNKSQRGPGLASRPSHGRAIENLDAGHPLRMARFRWPGTVPIFVSAKMVLSPFAVRALAKHARCRDCLLVCGLVLITIMWHIIAYSTRRTKVAFWMQEPPRAGELSKKAGCFPAAGLCPCGQNRPSGWAVRRPSTPKTPLPSWAFARSVARM